MAFVGVCIIFQAISSDIYVYNKKSPMVPTSVIPQVLPTTSVNASTIKPPGT